MAEKKLSFAIFGSASKALESIRIKELLGNLTQHEADIYLEQGFFHALENKLQEDLKIAGVFEGVNFDVDYVISLGGDGTFLKAASKVGPKQTPIIGVNMGRLGFLASVVPDEAQSILDDVFAGDVEIEERAVMQLEALGEPV